SDVDRAFDEMFGEVSTSSATAPHARGLGSEAEEGRAPAARPSSASAPARAKAGAASAPAKTNKAPAAAAPQPTRAAAKDRASTIAGAVARAADPSILNRSAGVGAGRAARASMPPEHSSLSSVQSLIQNALDNGDSDSAVELADRLVAKRGFSGAET